MNRKINLSPFLILLFLLTQANVAADSVIPTKLPLLDWKRTEISTGPFTHSVVWCGDSETLLITEFLPDSLNRQTNQMTARVVDVRTRATNVVPIRKNFRATVCTPDGKYVVLARIENAVTQNSDNNLYLYDRTRKNLIKVLASRYVVQNLTPWSFVNGRLITRPGAPASISLPNGDVIRTYHLSASMLDRDDLICAGVTSDQAPHILCYARPVQKSFAYDVNTSTRRLLPVGPLNRAHRPEGLSVSSRGNTIYLIARRLTANASQPGDVIYRLDLKDGKYRPPVLLFNSAGSFMPLSDGKYIFTFSKSSPNQLGLYIADSDGSLLAQLSENEVVGSTLSPDGKVFAYLTTERSIAIQNVESVKPLNVDRQ